MSRADRKLERAFQLGKDDYTDDVRFIENPYSPITELQESLMWSKGFTIERSSDNE